MSEQAYFILPLRVYIEDTDAGGIVFYANYLKYLERARTELMRSVGFELHKELEKKINYVVHSLELKYLRSAQLDDVIKVYACIEKIGRTFLLFKQKIENDTGQILVTATVKVACVDMESSKPRKLSSNLLEKLT